MVNLHKKRRDAVPARIHVIDALTWVPGYSSAYLVVSNEVALIETGLSSSTEAILQGIAACGVHPEEVAHILITHLHLDHAGGAGLLAKHLPHADILLHPMGIPRLADPARLLNSARKALGDFSKSYGLDGVLPVDPARLKPLVEGNVVDLGGTKLSVIETPGHAPHHLCLHDEASNGVFVGDAVGIYFPATDTVSLTTPSPNFDMDLCLKDIERMRARKPEVLYYSHYGPNRKVEQALGRAVEKLHQWDEIVQRAAKRRSDLESIARLLADDMAREAPLTPRWLHDELARLYAAGYIKYRNLDV